MVKLTKIYTRGGDTGQTSLVNGDRITKDDPRIEAYGTVDETNAILGLARQTTEGAADKMLERIQNDLFDLGADLATPAQEEGPDAFTPNEMVLRIVPAQVARLEQEIDQLNAELAPLNSFVLPGGSSASAWLHLARTAARRAERHTITATQQTAINPEAIKYLNRLSDHLFVLSRYLNKKGKNDVLWIPGANRGF